MSHFVAEGERTEESPESEDQSSDDARNESDETSEQRSGDSGDSGGGNSDGDGDSTDSPSSDKFDEDAPGGASVPADGVGDWDPPHEQEDESNFATEDAMGQDKRRTIIGQGYGPSRGRQLLYYGLFIAFVVAAVIGFQIAVSELDKAPAKDKDQAPWTGTQVPAQQFE